MSRFSVCIPHYGSESFLLEAVKSVADQSVRDFELIVSLDSPVSDAGLAQMRDWVPDIQVTHGPSNGIARNWNHCIEQVDSAYTVLLHSDDRLKPDYLALISTLIQQFEGADAWYCAVELIDEHGRATRSLADSIKGWIEPKQQEYKLQGDWGLARLLQGCFIYCPTVCYRTKTIQQLGFSQSWGMVLDLELYARLLMAGKGIVGTKAAQFEYRRHNQSTTAKLTKARTRFEEEWGLYEQLAKHAEAITWRKTAAVANRKLILRLHALFCALKALATFNVTLCGAYIRQMLVK